MHKHLIILTVLFVAGCTPTTSTSYETKEDRAKTDEQQQLQKDMQHNRCVSRGFFVGSKDYNKCMEGF